jgi:hypothetical protein
MCILSVNEQDIVGDEQVDKEARARAEIEIVVHASLKLGCKSITHATKAFDLVLPVLQSLLGIAEDM